MEQSRKDFIKKAHDNACSEWKTKIKKEFPKLFKEDALVVGKWYYYNNWLIEYFGKNTCLMANYGFDCDGNYFYDNEYNDFGNSPKKWVLATDKEVKKALIKEAKNIGFVKGVLISNENMGYHYKGMGYSYKGMCSSNKITFKHGVLSINNIFIMKDGKWATIIKETITKEQFEEAKEVLAQYHKQ